MVSLSLPFDEDASSKLKDSIKGLLTSDAVVKERLRKVYDRRKLKDKNASENQMNLFQ